MESDKWFTKATSTKISGSCGKLGWKKAVAAPVAIQAVFQVAPTADVVYRFVLDELF